MSIYNSAGCLFVRFRKQCNEKERHTYMYGARWKWKTRPIWFRRLNHKPTTATAEICWAKDCDKWNDKRMKWPVNRRKDWPNWSRFKVLCSKNQKHLKVCNQGERATDRAIRQLITQIGKRRIDCDRFGMPILKAKSPAIGGGLIHFEAAERAGVAMETQNKTTKT